MLGNGGETTKETQKKTKHRTQASDGMEEEREQVDGERGEGQSRVLSHRR